MIRQRAALTSGRPSNSGETSELKGLKTDAEVVLLLLNGEACCLNVFFIAFANKTNQER